MNIAEFVTRRGLMLRYLVIAALAIAYGAMFVVPQYYGTITKGKLVICLLPAFLLFWVFARTTKCPRCRSSLGDSIITAATPFSSEIPDACPNCGLSFNEPMRPPAEAP
jgi:hypothetical protein